MMNFSGPFYEGEKPNGTERTNDRPNTCGPSTKASPVAGVLARNPQRFDHLSRDELIALVTARAERRRDEQSLVRLQWDASRAERDLALHDSFVTMRLHEALSDQKAPWSNLVIEGENMDALKWLRMTMPSAFKCIFVDPPYGDVGEGLTYNDGVKDPSDAWKLTTWLEQLHRRFLVARELLAEDGVLFVCINDENRAVLELMLDQTLPGMKAGSLVWRTRAGTKGEGIFLSGDHEHVLIYAGPRFRFGGSLPDLNKYSNPDADTRGSWLSVALQTNKTFTQRRNSYFPVQNPNTGHWHPCNPNRVWSFQRREQGTARGATFEDMLEDKTLLFGKEGQHVVYPTREVLDAAIAEGTAHPYLRADLPDLDFWVDCLIAVGSVRKKQFLKKLKTATKPLSSWINGLNDPSDEENKFVISSGLYQEGTSQLRKLMGTDVFAHPKPVSLVRELIRQSTQPGDLILDFYAGSGTTGQAVMELNKDSEDDRRFVLVSHAEPTKEQPDRNLARDVIAERMRRVNAGAIKTDERAPAPFAYLRADTVPSDTIMDDGALPPADIWLAVQSMHGIPLRPYDEDAPLQIAGNGDEIVVFCDEATAASVAAVKAAASAQVLASRTFTLGRPAHCAAPWRVVQWNCMPCPVLCGIVTADERKTR